MSKPAGKKTTRAVKSKPVKSKPAKSTPAAKRKAPAPIVSTGYWLFKSEPDVFSFDALKKKGSKGDDDGDDDNGDEDEP